MNNINKLTFSEALELLKNGCKVQRKGWKDEWIQIAPPYIYIKTCENKLFPWTPHQMDILADDWIISR